MWLPSCLFFCFIVMLGSTCHDWLGYGPIIPEVSALAVVRYGCTDLLYATAFPHPCSVHYIYNLTNISGAPLACFNSDLHERTENLGKRPCSGSGLCLQDTSYSNFTNFSCGSCGGLLPDFKFVKENECSPSICCKAPSTTPSSLSELELPPLAYYMITPVPNEPPLMIRIDDDTFVEPYSPYARKALSAGQIGSFFHYQSTILTSHHYEFSVVNAHRSSAYGADGITIGVGYQLQSPLPTGGPDISNVQPIVDHTMLSKRGDGTSNGTRVYAKAGFSVSADQAEEVAVRSLATDDIMHTDAQYRAALNSEQTLLSRSISFFSFENLLFPYYLQRKEVYKPVVWRRYEDRDTALPATHFGGAIDAQACGVGVGHQLMPLENESLPSQSRKGVTPSKAVQFLSHRYNVFVSGEDSDGILHRRESPTHFSNVFAPHSFFRHPNVRKALEGEESFTSTTTLYPVDIQVVPHVARIFKLSDGSYRFVPLDDLPDYYGESTFNRLASTFSKDHRIARYSMDGAAVYVPGSREVIFYGENRNGRFGIGPATVGVALRGFTVNVSFPESNPGNDVIVELSLGYEHIAVITRSLLPIGGKNKGFLAGNLVNSPSCAGGAVVTSYYTQVSFASKFLPISVAAGANFSVFVLAGVEAERFIQICGNQSYLSQLDSTLKQTDTWRPEKVIAGINHFCLISRTQDANTDANNIFTPLCYGVSNYLLSSVRGEDGEPLQEGMESFDPEKSQRLCASSDDDPKTRTHDDAVPYLDRVYDVISGDHHVVFVTAESDGTFSFVSCGSNTNGQLGGNFLIPKIIVGTTAPSFSVSKQILDVSSTGATGALFRVVGVVAIARMTLVFTASTPAADGAAVLSRVSKATGFLPPSDLYTFSSSSSSGTTASTSNINTSWFMDFHLLKGLSLYLVANQSAFDQRIFPEQNETLRLLPHDANDTISGSSFFRNWYSLERNDTKATVDPRDEEVFDVAGKIVFSSLFFQLSDGRVFRQKDLSACRIEDGSWCTEETKERIWGGSAHLPPPTGYTDALDNRSISSATSSGKSLWVAFFVHVHTINLLTAVRAVDPVDALQRAIEQREAEIEQIVRNDFCTFRAVRTFTQCSSIVFRERFSKKNIYGYQSSYPDEKFRTFPYNLTSSTLFSYSTNGFEVAPGNSIIPRFGGLALYFPSKHILSLLADWQHDQCFLFKIEGFFYYIQLDQHIGEALSGRTKMCSVAYNASKFFIPSSSTGPLALQDGSWSYDEGNGTLVMTFESTKQFTFILGGFGGVSGYSSFVIFSPTLASYVVDSTTNTMKYNTVQELEAAGVNLLSTSGGVVIPLASATNFTSCYVKFEVRTHGNNAQHIEVFLDFLSAEVYFNSSDAKPFFRFVASDGRPRLELVVAKSVVTWKSREIRDWNGGPFPGNTTDEFGCVPYFFRALKMHTIIIEKLDVRNSTNTATAIYADNQLVCVGLLPIPFPQFLTGLQIGARSQHHFHQLNHKDPVLFYDLVLCDKGPYNPHSIFPCRIANKSFEWSGFSSTISESLQPTVTSTLTFTESSTNTLSMTDTTSHSTSATSSVNESITFSLTPSLSFSRSKSHSLSESIERNVSMHLVEGRSTTMFTIVIARDGQQLLFRLEDDVWDPRINFIDEMMNHIVLTSSVSTDENPSGFVGSALNRPHFIRGEVSRFTSSILAIHFGPESLYNSFANEEVNMTVLHTATAGKFEVSKTFSLTIVGIGYQMDYKMRVVELVSGLLSLMVVLLGVDSSMITKAASTTLLSNFQCFNAEDTPMGYMLNPFGVTVDGSQRLGAITASGSVICAIILFHFGSACCMKIFFKVPFRRAQGLVGFPSLTLAMCSAFFPGLLFPAWLYAWEQSSIAIFATIGAVTVLVIAVPMVFFLNNLYDDANFCAVFIDYTEEEKQEWKEMMAPTRSLRKVCSFFKVFGRWKSTDGLNSFAYRYQYCIRFVSARRKYWFIIEVLELCTVAVTMAIPNNSFLICGGELIGVLCIHLALILTTAYHRVYAYRFGNFFTATFHGAQVAFVIAKLSEVYKGPSEFLGLVIYTFLFSCHIFLQLVMTICLFFVAYESFHLRRKRQKLKKVSELQPRAAKLEDRTSTGILQASQLLLQRKVMAGEDLDDPWSGLDFDGQEEEEEEEPQCHTLSFAGQSEADTQGRRELSSPCSSSPSADPVEIPSLKKSIDQESAISVGGPGLLHRVQSPPSLSSPVKMPSRNTKQQQQGTHSAPPLPKTDPSRDFWRMVALEEATGRACPPLPLHPRFTSVTDRDLLLDDDL